MEVDIGKLKKGVVSLWAKLFGAQGIFYIGGHDVLPPPLSQEDERAYVKRAAGGDKWAKGQLIEHNLRLVVYIARKFENTGIGIEDLISTGTIGLIKAVNTFDGEKKIKLATYASRCIENEILMHLRKTSRIKFEVSIDEPLRYGLQNGEERTQKQVADMMGISQSYISRLEKRIIKRLKKEMVRNSG